MRNACLSPARFRLLLLLALLALLPMRLAAQDANGHWKGTIKLPGVELAFDVDLASKDGAWSGDITIPQQGATNLPLGEISVNGPQIRFKIPGVPGDPTFTGTIAADGKSISGNLSQGGQAFPFTLEKPQDAGPATAAALQALDPIFEQAMKDLLVPGMAIGIVKDGKVVEMKGYGYRDVANKLPVTPKTLFAIGSATKAFTTFAMGRLVDQGKLKWDEPAIRYLPGLRLNDEYATAHITPRDMVTHRSGLPRHDLVWYNNQELDPAALFTRLGEFPATKELRQTFQYNNLMYATAGHLVSRLYGKSWEVAVRELIFQPLGMTSSNFSVVESQKAQDFALPYGESKDTLRKLSFRNITNIGPAGSINSNIEDMTKWVQLHLSDGSLQGQRLVNKATLDEMHTPQMILGGMSTEPMISPASYGLGWFIDTYRGHYRVQHGGNIDGFSALVTLFPNDNTGIVVLTNKNASGLPELAARHIADRLFALPNKDWIGEALARRKAARETARQGEQRAEGERRKGTSPSHAMGEYVGEYEHAGYGIMRIAQEPGKNGRLTMTFNGITTPLEHWHYDVFRGLENPQDPAFQGFRIQFQTDLDGQVSGISAAIEPMLPPAVFNRRPDALLSDASHIARFAGTYQLSSQKVTVTQNGNRLTMTVPGQPTYELEPSRNNTFTLKGLNGYRVRFTVDEKGKVTEMVALQPNGIFPAKRVD